MNKTTIEWTDFTANPIKYRDPSGRSVWGCVKASTGCINCYAEAISKRFHGPDAGFTAKRMATLTPYLDKAELKAMLSPKRLPPGSNVFVGDMTDLFGPWVPFEMLDQVFAVFALRPDVTIQLLTKRPCCSRDYVRSSARHAMVAERVSLELDGDPGRRDAPDEYTTWPLPNVWLGTSVEDQQRADERIPALLATPAAVRFISAEPLLGPIDLGLTIEAGEKLTDSQVAELRAELERQYRGMAAAHNVLELAPAAESKQLLNWVIVGGESGPGARPMDLAWARSLRDQCQAAGTAFFMKQMGAAPYRAHPIGGATEACPPDWIGHFNRTPTECRHDKDGPDIYSLKPGGMHVFEHPSATLKLRNRKGGDMAEWPEDLRMREFPNA